MQRGKEKERGEGGREERREGVKRRGKQQEGK
jgi:hypothetical protein